MSWFGVRCVFTYEVRSEPLAELVDDGFVADWRGFEESLQLVSADSFDAARAALRAACGEVEFVNVYGQKIEKRLASIDDVYAIADYELAASAAIESPLEVYSNIVEASSKVNLEAFVDRRVSLSEAPHEMIMDMELSERRERYASLMAAAEKESEGGLSAESTS